MFTWKKKIRIKPNILRLKTDHEFWDLFLFQYYQHGYRKQDFYEVMSCLFENKLQSLWRLRNERCYEELDTCNNHLIVVKNTILLKFMIHLINHIRCVARMEMKCTHKKGRGMGAAARPPVDPGQSPGWGQGGQSWRKLLCFL